MEPTAFIPILYIASIALTAYLAKKKGRKIVLWILIGIILPFVSLVIVAVMKNVERAVHSAAAPIKGKAPQPQSAPVEYKGKLSKLIEQSRDHLDQDEEVIAAVQGAYEIEMMKVDTVRTGALIATTKRVVFFAKKIGGFALESFPYSNISSFEMSKGITGHEITFFASGNKVRLKWIAKGDVAGVVKAVKERMTGSSAPQAPIQQMQAEANIPKQIEKLAELRDKGILKEEEFEAKKESLLAKM